MMRKIQALVCFIIVACAPFALHAQSVVKQDIAPAVTAVAATTTNATAGTVFFIDNPVSRARLYVQFSGTAATTNGSFIVKFSTATGNATSTNAFDTASTSNIKVTESVGGSGTAISASDWFALDGVRYLRVGQMENTFLGPVSNIVISLSAPTGSTR